MAQGLLCAGTVVRGPAGCSEWRARKTVELALDGRAATVEVASLLTVPLDARAERLNRRPPRASWGQNSVVSFQM